MLGDEAVAALPGLWGRKARYGQGEPRRWRLPSGQSLRLPEEHGWPCLTCLQPDWSEGCLARLLSSRLWPLLAGSLAEGRAVAVREVRPVGAGGALAVAVARRSHVREQSQVSAWVLVFNRPSEGNL